MNKYRAQKVEHKGIKFDSKLEYEYYLFLMDKKAKGKIKEVILHKRIDLIVNGQLVCFMKPDFSILNNDFSIEYHDTKGVVTSSFRLKAKLFKALKDREIKIIKRGDKWE